jgi:2-polyprenyl-3-methyl-5-hydroxy-6-metoxy-1,4-benzoquinol methylase
MNTMLSSSICKYTDFNTPWFNKWKEELKLPDFPARKYWEYAAIIEVLNARGKLREGMKGIGFAVGSEPLASLMASKGVNILASDLAIEEQIQDWSAWGQHATSLDAIYKPEIVSREEFERLVSFRPINMAYLNEIPEESYDFAWSSCAFEHIGNLEDGLKFVVDAMRLVKPGGIAVHTTEINLSSNHETLSDGGLCIYRKRDIEQLDRRLRIHRCGIENVDWNAGCEIEDLNFDTPPYFSSGKPHIKLELEGFITTSILLVVRKGG